MDSPLPDESASIIGKDAVELKNVAEYGTRGDPDGSESYSTEPESMESDAEYKRHEADGDESSEKEESDGEDGKKGKKMRDVWDNKVALSFGCSLRG